jgi:hypothetical protein
MPVSRRKLLAGCAAVLAARDDGAQRLDGLGHAGARHLAPDRVGEDLPTHANDVAHILRRLTLKFPADLQVQAFHDVLSSTQASAMPARATSRRTGSVRTCHSRRQTRPPPTFGTRPRPVTRSTPRPTPTTWRTSCGGSP